MPQEGEGVATITTHELPLKVYPLLHWLQVGGLMAPLVQVAAAWVVKLLVA
jgi:hypothetical protein